MGLMAQFVDRLGVMYAGKLVEVGQVRDIFSRAAAPVHPAADRQPAVARREGRLARHPGRCRRRCSIRRRAASFHPRCPHVMPRCSRRSPGCSWKHARTARWPATCTTDDCACRLLEARNVSRGLRQRTRNANVALDDFSLTVGDDVAVVHGHRRRERQRQDDAGAPAARLHPADVWRGALPRQEPLEDGARRLDGVPPRSAGHLSGPVRGLQPVLQGRPPADGANRQVSARQSKAEAREPDRGGAGGGRACGRRRRSGATRTS